MSLENANPTIVFMILFPFVIWAVVMLLYCFNYWLKKRKDMKEYISAWDVAGHGDERE